MIERDNVLNTLSNSRGFACQESAKNVSWPWLSPLQGSDGLTTGCPHGFCKKNSRTFPIQNSKITEQQQNKFSLTLRDQHKSRKFNNYDCYTHILRLTLTMMAVVIKFSLYFQKQQHKFIYNISVKLKALAAEFLDHIHASDTQKNLFQILYMLLSNK